MQKLNRREFLRISSLVAAGTVAAACAQPAAPSPAAPAEPTAAAPAAQPTTPGIVGPGGTSSQPTAMPTAAAPAEPVAGRYKEAPMLAELVAAGELPPVEERLPENPDVAVAVEMVGKYGGSLRRGFNGVSDRWGPTKFKSTNLTWFNLDLTLRAAQAESWEINDDATEWTWHMRKGIKWSDGTPLTSADFRWWWDYQVNNRDITPATSTQVSTLDANGDRVMGTLETPDDFTVVYKFVSPYPLFGFAVLGHGNQPYRPGWFMQQYHMDLAEDKDALAAAATAAGFNTWADYYNDRDLWYLNPERPTTDPWMAMNPLSEELFIMERNPYFWQVDEEGQQLPYIDTVNHRLFETPDVFNLWIVNGEIDHQARHVNIGNFTLFKENEADGDYRVAIGITANHLALQLNQTTKEPRLREFFQDRNVRIAISHAINREEINELIYDGLLTPRQYSPIEQSPNYYEKLSNAFIEYNPDEANRLLDEAGYTEKDGDGFRTFKDGSGETISFTIEGTAPTGDPQEDAAQLLVGYLAEVGVKATYRYFERSLYTEHYEANEIEAAWWGGDRTVLPLLAPTIFDGTTLDRPWAAAWGRWRNDPTHASAEEPPEGHWIWDIWDAIDRALLEPDEATRNAIFQEALDVWAEELPMIGVLGQMPNLIIVKNGLRNYVDGYPSDDRLKDEYLQDSQMFFWE